MLKYVRLLGLIGMSINVGLFLFNVGLSIDPYKYFTVWGMIFSFTCYATGTWIVFHKNEDSVFNEAQKHSPLCAWKIYIFMFETSIAIEIIITVVFWLILWPDASKAPEFQPPIRKIGLILDHTLPIACLTLDYFINAIPVI